MGAIEKCRIETKQAMQSYDSSLIVNLDETRFAPFANSNYSYQYTLEDGSSFPRKEQNQKRVSLYFVASPLIMNLFLLYSS